ncbi:peptidase [Fodinibius sp.]|uniref:peptidase n=1 Tax=Fodinibius sp. TaxID=1872440 RepID=UPI003568D281
MGIIKRHQLIVLCIALVLSLTAYGCLDSPSGVDENTNQFVSTATPGTSAEVFLTDSSFTRLELEIDYMPGHQPSQQALDSLKSFLQTRLQKSEVVITTPTEVQSGGGGTYSADEIRAFEEEYRDTYTDSRDHTLHAYFLITDGKFQEQNNVLAIAYFNTSMAFFGETVEEASSGIGAPPREKIEGTIFQHEFGHILGLVGNGTPTQSDHKTAGSAHCTAEGCLMEPSVETTDFFANLFDGSIPDLDAQCIADLQANGGK